MSPDAVPVSSIKQPDETGIDTPCEKETPTPEQGQTPSMGALPVDKPGSNKQQKNTTETEVVATGSGPDPEHYED